MQTQQRISTAKLQARIGQVIPIIVDEVTDEEVIARTYGDAPEIDGNIFLPSGYDLQPGDTLYAEVMSADEYDLYGEPVEVEFD